MFPFVLVSCDNNVCLCGIRQVVTGFLRCAAKFKQFEVSFFILFAACQSEVILRCTFVIKARLNDSDFMTEFAFVIAAVTCGFLSKAGRSVTHKLM